MKKLRDAIRELTFGMAMLSLLVCGTSGYVRAETDPIWPTKEWQISTPEEQGMDSAALASLVDLGQTLNLDSLLVVRHGKLVLDAYYAPYTADITHAVNSVTKSVTGTLAGIALKDGVLDSTSHPMLDFFGDRGVDSADSRKAAITIQHLLDMTSGLAWKEPLSDERPDSMIDMERSQDWIKFILDRPMAAAPGETFNYNTGNSHLLSAILAKVTGVSTEDYAKAKLFGPLGITRWQWGRDPQGVSMGGYRLALLPRDMAKFGYLYLHRGEWDGKQLIAPEWTDKVNHATVNMNAQFNKALRYSNQFWATPDRGLYWANGYHCQTIAVYPALDMVAVTTARDDCAFGKLSSHVTKAARSSKALPPNPVAASQLDSTLREIATEKPTDHSVTSSLASAVSGKTYSFQRNGLLVKSLSLTLDGSQPRYDLELYSSNPNNPASKVSGPIGLDGLYPKGEPAGSAVSAVKGKWLNTHAFEIERLTIGGSSLAQKWTLWFDGETLNLRGKRFDGREVSIDSGPGG
jgi:CubicO group peptidase (beta-lactamase class C family)